MKGQRKEPACFIVGAGSFDGFLTEPQEGDLVIAADGGYAYLKRLGREPDVLMGDFDSLKEIPQRELIRHSPIKDDTDMALAGRIRNVDLIIGGHSHTFLESPSVVSDLDGNPVTVVTDGCWGLYVGNLKAGLPE